MSSPILGTKLPVGGVIVAYYPDPHEFAHVVKSVLRQVDFLVIVNNSESPLSELKQEDFTDNNVHQLSIIENVENLGIASALNLGLELLKQCGCYYFLLLDHDSVIPDGMVAKLTATYQLMSQTQQVAAVGPAYFNARLNKFAPFIKFGNWSLEKIAVPHKPAIVETHFLISSGSIISLDALNQIGAMEEDLFIDYVDTEWCLRAISKGYHLYGVSDVVMEHSLGDKPLILFGRSFPMHSPLRHYYLVRNAITLTKRKYIPINWRIVIFIRMFRSFIFYSIFPTNRFSHLTKMFKGVIDGLNNKMGKFV